MGPLTRIAVATAAALLVGAASAQAYVLGPGPALPPRDPLVSMEVTGGFTGGTADLLIGRHGTSRLDNRQGSTGFRVSARRLAALRKALRQTHWRGLRDDYPAPRAIDGLHYTILYEGRAVRTEDGAKRPRRLTRVLALLARIANRHGGFL